VRKCVIACVLASALLFAACALPWKGDPAMSLPDQAMPATRHQVVPWLRCSRFYTRDSGRSIRKKGAVAEMVRKLAAHGGNALRISVSWGGDAFFQSNVMPHAPKLGDVDYIREAVDEGRRQGVRIVTYINPNCIYDDNPQFPEAVIEQPDGTPWLAPAYGRKHNFYVCFNKPKCRKLLLDTITEIFTRYGPDGLYLDGLSAHICFCPHCRARYRKMFGRDMPAKFQRHGPIGVLWEMTSVPQLIGDPTDPDSYRLTKFLAASMHDLTRDVTAAVKRAKPDAVVIYHSWPKPSTLKYYDATLDEIYLRRPWRHTLWKDGEFASFGAPFPIAMLHNIYLQHKTEAEARHKMVQALANGVYPNAWGTYGMKPIYGFVKAHERLYDFNAVQPVRHVALVRELRRSAVQRKIAGTVASGIWLDGDRCWLRLGEREPRGKIDLLCLRRDGHTPSDAEWRKRRGKSTANTLYLPATGFDPARSTTSAGGKGWNTGTGEGALSGRYVVATGTGISREPATALHYKLPSTAKGGRWALWARVLWPNSGSDSFYWAVSRDNGATWQDTIGDKAMAAGWKPADTWQWVRAGVAPGGTVSPTQHSIDEFLSPYVGAYSLLLHARVPMTTLHRRMIDDRVHDYRALWLANEAALSDDQLRTLRRFVRNGGGLIVTGQTSLFNERGEPRRDFGLAGLLGVRYRGARVYPGPRPEDDDIAAVARWRLRVTASHPVTRGLSKATIPIVEDICQVEPKGAQVLAVIRGEGLPDGGVPAVLAHEYGKGRVVYLPNRIDSTFSHWLDPAAPRLVANAVGWVCRGRVPCRVTSKAGRVSVRLTDRADCRIVHLVNHTGDPIAKYTEFPPVHDLDIDLEVPEGKRVACVRALWSKSTLPHRVADGRVRVRLPRLDEYEVVVVEWK